MAFGFLKDVGNIVTGVSGVASLFGDKDEPRASKQSSAALNEAIKLAKASADPNSPEFQNLARLEEENLREAAVKQIQEFLEQNQRNVARGGISGIVNPERRDEAVMKSLAQAFQGAKQSARLSARQTLANAAGSLTGAGKGLYAPAVIQNTIQDQNTRRRAGLGEAIGDSLGALGGAMNNWFPDKQESPIPKPGSTQIALR